MRQKVVRPVLALAAALFAIAPVASLALAEETAILGQKLVRYQELDQRFQDIGWKLAMGNAPYCENAPLAVGLQLRDIRVFERPENIAKALGQSSDFAVQTVAKGSPASHELVANQNITAIDGSILAQWPAGERNHWQRLARAHDAIDASLVDNGEVEITPEGAEPVTLKGVPACASRFELATGHGRAMAEGKRVILGEKFVGFSFPEDELAAAVAHELAHNLLGHRVWLEEHGRKRRNVRATEREADRLMPWLLANAGYQPEAALRFMERWGPEHSRGFLTRARTHEGWGKRAEHIAKEVARVKALQAESGLNRGSAEWTTGFPREITPEGELTPAD